jgi:cell division protein FtsW (lipid II flippase)
MSQVSRPAVDGPLLRAEPRDDERKSASWRALSLENQLWIEISLLVLFGLVMIYSASSIMALKKFSDPSY